MVLRKPEHVQLARDILALDRQDQLAAIGELIATQKVTRLLIAGMLSGTDEADALLTCSDPYFEGIRRFRDRVDASVDAIVGTIREENIRLRELENVQDPKKCHCVWGRSHQRSCPQWELPF